MTRFAFAVWWTSAAIFALATMAALHVPLFGHGRWKEHDRHLARHPDLGGAPAGAIGLSAHRAPSIESSPPREVAESERHRPSARSATRSSLANAKPEVAAAAAMLQRAKRERSLE